MFPLTASPFSSGSPTHASQNPVWYLHSLATGTSRALAGTETTTSTYWSFDSRSILLSHRNVFWRMDLNGGPPQRSPVAGAYTSWQREGIITGGRSGLRWFRPDGTGVQWVKKGTGYSYPSLIPGGHWLMYNTAETEDAAAGISLHFASLDGKVDRQILTGEHAAIYAGPGYLLYRHGDTLTAQGIDPESGKLRGDPAPITGPIGTAAGIADQLGSFSASDNGVLAFRSPDIAGNRLTWLDSSGKSLGTVGRAADYSNPRMSPDGNRLAVVIKDPSDRQTRHLGFRPAAGCGFARHLRFGRRFQSGLVAGWDAHRFRLRPPGRAWPVRQERVRSRRRQTTAFVRGPKGRGGLVAGRTLDCI